jgi:hypothetical protein
MADLTVDFALLSKLHSSLVGVADEFEDLHTRRELEEHIWGGAQTRSAMGHFASNWDRHREDLTEQIQKLAGHCGCVAAEFHRVDQAVARAAGGE